jgi:uncharacterized membrane protein
MLFFEIGIIILTIFAWNRGWKWRSLIPLVVLLICEFLIGLLFNILNGSLDTALLVGKILEAIIFIILLSMCRMKYANNNYKNEKK